jgi:hypothetical protein
MIVNLLVFLAIVFPGQDRVQAPDSFIGTWRLVSLVGVDSNGQSRAPWGDHPSGLLIYTRDGHMSGQMYDPRRPRLGEIAFVTALAPVQPTFTGLYTYFGTYSVHTVAKTITHHVEGAMAPDWIGGNQIRSYRFLTPDRLELRVVTDAAGETVAGQLTLVWERIRR